MPSPWRSDSRRPKGSNNSPAINQEEIMIAPSHAVVSFHETTSLKEDDEDDSCMDLCSSSDDSVSVAQKLSPVNIGLQQKLKYAKGIFGTAPIKREMVDVCSSSKDEAEQCLKRLKSSHNNRKERRLVFDQVYHVGGRDESYRRPMEPFLLLSGSKHHSSNDSSSNENDTEWREFGIFSPMQNEAKAISLEDVLPEFSPSELSFFTDMKLYNVEDLKRANTNGLGIHLYESIKFRKACAFFAWKDGKPLRDYLRFTVARNTVVKWKKKLVVKNEPDNKMNDAESSTQMSQAESMGTKDIPLTNILSSVEARMLHDHFGIETAAQLINADGHYMRQTVSGLISSWVLRSREAVESTESESTATTATMEMKRSESYASSEVELSQHTSIQTPLSYVDFLFFEQQGISTDHELSLIDPSLLTRHYTAFFNTKGKGISYVEANKKLKRLRHEASLLCSGASVDLNSPQKARLDLSKLPKGVMLNASNLCKTTIDKSNNGLPKKTLVVYDDQNFVLYEFLVSIDDSSIKDSGKGAFLTFK